MRTLSATWAGAWLLLAALPVGAAEPDNASQPDPAAGQAQYSGTFEGGRLVPVAYRPEAWSEATFLRLVKHGTRVNKGDLVAELDSSKLQQALEDAKMNVEATTLQVQQARKELELSEPRLALRLTAAELAKQHAEVDLERFVKFDKPFAMKRAEFQVTQHEWGLKYQQEELEQLQKMYEADDLTEETEEIILERQKNAVKRSQFRLEQARLERQRALEVELPRKLAELRQAARAAEVSLEKAKANAQQHKAQQQMELQKATRQLERQRQRLAKLQEDLAGMRVRAPADGIVYYGVVSAGQWQLPPALRNRLTEGGTIRADEVFATIVDPRPLRFRMKVKEAQLRHVRIGQHAMVVPSAFPDQQLPAMVRMVSLVPVAPGTFVAELEVQDLPDRLTIMPGMSGKATLVEPEGEPR